VTTLDLPPANGIAPFPTSDDEATPDRIAAHFAAQAYLAGRVALTHPDPVVSGQACRDAGLHYAIAYLMRAFATSAAWAATVAARAIREELEDGTHLQVDLADWLREYKIQPEVVDVVARHLVTGTSLSRSEREEMQAELERLQDALADAQGSADREDALTLKLADVTAERDAAIHDREFLAGPIRQQIAAAIDWDALKTEVARIIAAGEKAPEDHIVDAVMVAAWKAVQS